MGRGVGEPPVDWAAGSLVRRDEGSGWTNHTNLFDDHLCPSCQDAVMAVLKKPRQPVTCATWSAAVAVCKNCGGAFNDHQPRIHTEAPDAD